MVVDDYFETLTYYGVEDDDPIVDEFDQAESRVKVRAKKKAKRDLKKKKTTPPTTTASKPAMKSSSSKSSSKKKVIEKKKKKTTPPPADPTNPEDWEDGLKRKPPRKDQNLGDVLSNSYNAQLVFSCDPRWKGVLAYDEFIGDIVALKPPPWHAEAAPKKTAVGPWTDVDTARAEMWLTKEFGFSLHLSSVGAALRVTAERRPYHPVRRWLRSLTWDGKKRLGNWLVKFCGAKNTPYIRAVGQNFLIGAVARAMQPGSQVDSMPVFEGAQGIGKSSMLRALAGPWFLETSIEVGTKDSYQVLRGKWIVEWGEMGSMSRSEINRVKQYITERSSTYRPSYGTRAMDFLRQCVFAGTTNNQEYLKDETGARRFNPVMLGKIDLAGLKEAREQIFAEAYAMFKAGVGWHFQDEGLISAQAIEAEARRQIDPWEGALSTWLSDFSEQERFDGISTHDALLHGIHVSASQMTRGDEMRCGSVLRTLGWTVVKKKYEGRTTARHYCPEGPTITPMSAAGKEKTRLERMTSEERKKDREARRKAKVASKKGPFEVLQGGKDA